MARTLSAGLDANQSLTAIIGSVNGRFDKELKKSQQLVRSGTSLLRALDHIGLISAHDRALLKMAEDHGNFDFACEQLASRYQRSHARWRQVKGRLMMPAAVLVFAIILLPLPALAAGKLNGVNYILQVFSMLALLIMLSKLVHMFVMHWQAKGSPSGLTHLSRMLPGLGKLSKLHQRADVTERIALALRCGSPAVETLNMMIHSEHNKVFKTDLISVRKNLNKNGDFAQALQRSDLLTASGFAIVSTGESAGRLDESIKRVSDQYFDELDAYYGLIAQWFPVLVYSCVAGVVIAGLLG